MRLAKVVIAFYVDGFRAMRLGRALWRIVLVKLFFLFAVLKVFFFQDFLGSRFPDEDQRAAHVLQELTAVYSAEKQENRR